MKTAIRIMAAGLAASLALVSCAKQEVMDNGSTSPAGGARTIAVSFANASVKSALGEDGLTPKFVATDVIKVSNGSATEDCTVEIDGSGNASITTELTGALTMVYPAAAAKMNGNAIEGVLVPTVQDGSFASANICKATITEGAAEAQFANQTAVLRFYVDASIGVKSITVTSSTSDIATGAKTITVDPAGDVTLDTVTDGPDKRICYVAVLPVTESTDLTFTSVTTTQTTYPDNTVSRTVSSTTLAKGTMYNAFIPYYIKIKVSDSPVTYQKWAYCNVGAFLPEDYGKLYSWGNIDGQSGDSFNPAFKEANYKNTEGYKINDTDHLWDKTKHDAAYNEWGGSWRMPTGNMAGEFAALKAATYWKWEDGGYYVYTPNPATDAGKINGEGTGIYSKSDALLFFPAAGFSSGASRSYAGSYGYYWSSTWYSSSYACFLKFYSSGVNPLSNERRYPGFSVRPVSD